MRYIRALTCLIGLILLLHTATCWAADWPQFHGPDRANISPDKNLAKIWPPGGPRLLWKNSQIGSGFSSVCIVDGKIYTAGNIGTDEVVSALDYSGRILWQAKAGRAYRRSYAGARATPTYSEGKLYQLCGEGDLVCLDAQTGKKVWGFNILEKFDGQPVRWGIAESVLVDGDILFCYPGGKKADMVALDKNTGRVIWVCDEINDLPAYVSPRLVEFAGTKMILTLSANWALGVDARTGRLLWKYPHEVAFDVNCTTPIFDAGFVYLFGTWGKGTTKLRLIPATPRWQVEVVWQTPELDNEHGGVILLNGYLYGQADGNHRHRHWACVEAETGRTAWTDDRLAGIRSASFTMANGMFYIVSDRGEVGLVRPDPKQFEIVSTFSIDKESPGPLYAHPVVLDGRLYIRHDRTLYVYDVASP